MKKTGICLGRRRTSILDLDANGNKAYDSVNKFYCGVVRSATKLVGGDIIGGG